MKRRTFLAAATGSLTVTHLARPAHAAGSTAGHYTVRLPVDAGPVRLGVTSSE